MHCPYFICERKFYVHTQVKITRQWKSSLSSRRIGNPDLLTHHCHAIFTLLKTGVVYFFLNSKRNIFERLASTGNLFMYLLSHFFIYLVILAGNLRLFFRARSLPRTSL